jgi:hypothetical protein
MPLTLPPISQPMITGVSRPICGFLRVDPRLSLETCKGLGKCATLLNEQFWCFATAILIVMSNDENAEEIV